MGVAGIAAVTNKIGSILFFAGSFNAQLGKECGVISNFKNISLFTILHDHKKIGSISRHDFSGAGKNRIPMAIKKVHKSCLYNS